MDTPNIRTMTISTEMAKDVRDTSMLKPGAHRTSAENSKNVTKQYETSSVPHGPGEDGAHNAGV
jgi:hypothetical protein